GCAGAYEDRAKKTTKAVAELLAAAGVKFLVLGEGETCTGDSARRSGNEFLFQQLAAQNVETLNDLFEGVERVDRKVVVTCPHCFNTLSREYPQVGGNYTVLHHTQLLNRLVRDKKLIPVKPAGGGLDITYHDPCYLGRHNKEYTAPRELIGAAGAKLTEMPRHADRGLCCGAGGARMWMEEHIGKRVNTERTEEAMDTASTIATGCPFCRVMITDGVDEVSAARNVDKAEVLDVAQLLLNSLDKNAVTLPEKGTAAKEAEERAAKKAAEAPAKEEPVKAEAAEPEAKPAATAAPASTETKPVTGLGIAGGAKRPGAKKAAPAAAEAGDEKPAAAPAPAKGLGLAAGAKRPGAKKAAPAAPAASAAPAAEAPAEAAKPAPEVKGLGLAAGARRPGAKKAAPAAPAAPTAAAAPVAAAPAAAPAAEAKPEPEVKGLGIAPGARRPGAKKAPAATPTAPANPAAAQPEPAPAAERAAESAPAPAPSAGDSAPAAKDDRIVGDEPPVKGLGIAKGARRPGKR
ncbi:(Fe-S)-binding protein, partial [Mycolicibacterium phlei]|uniref:(Fe-S)-binding protein n=1 Tax=Mycolicibacterium phlei TaxID=1771 RepID=UPI0037C5FA75